MSRIKSVLNAIITISFCFYGGHFIFVLWNHYRHPEYYAMQSAPWYTSLWVNGLLVLTVVLICTMIKIVLNYIEKRKKP